MSESSISTKEVEKKVITGEIKVVSSDEEMGVSSDFDNSTLILPTETERIVPGGCAVCLSPYEVGEQVIYASEDSCLHCFHHDCIVQWLAKKRDSKCPLCRQAFCAPTDVEPAESSSQQHQAMQSPYLTNHRELSLLVLQNSLRNSSMSRRSPFGTSGMSSSTPQSSTVVLPTRVVTEEEEIIIPPDRDSSPENVDATLPVANQEVLEENRDSQETEDDFLEASDGNQTSPSSGDVDTGSIGQSPGQSSTEMAELCEGKNGTIPDNSNVQREGDESS